MVRKIVKWGVLGLLALLVGVTLWVALYAVLNPTSTPYMRSEAHRLGEIRRTWRNLEDIAPVMAQAAVAAEDANFCTHWGLDFAAIRAALADGSGRGGSTITQQVVKNVFLWHERSWLRKGLEAGLTPLVELTWSKRRIVEVYLNIAEFDEGIFGVDAASLWYFGTPADRLTLRQAAQLAAVLPAPKTRSARANTSRSRQIAQGAETIAADGRAACFTD